MSAELSALATVVSNRDATVGRKMAANDGELRECDDDVNDSSRAVVRAMWAAHGAAWLVKVNRRVREGSPLVAWDGGTVFNFTAELVVPRFDVDLERLLLDREAAHTTVGDAARLDAIFAHARAIGGQLLIWS